MALHPNPSHLKKSQSTMGYLDKIFADDIVLLILGEPVGKTNFLDAVYELKGVTERRGWLTYASCPCIMSIRVQDHDRLVLVKATRFDHDGFNLVCNWLQNTYRAGIKLSGIVYMHSIASEGPSPIIHSLGNICGVSALKKVMLVITECEMVEMQTSERKWSELSNDWDELVKRGVTVERFDDNTSSLASESARKILDHFINGEKDRLPLLLQEEMIDQRMEFRATTIGRFKTQFPNVETGDTDNRWRIMGNFAALRAIHNSKDRYDPPKCHPNTRVAIRGKLMSWILGQTTTGAQILWLYGAAGIGKSAIAQTIAETCDQQKLLLASFFFSRTDSTRNTVNPLIATITYQIGNAIPQIQELILKVVERNEKIFTESLATQLTELICQPLSEFARGGDGVLDFPRLVIIDGLDECFGHETQSQIVVDLSRALQNAALPSLRYLIVSRGEQHLKDTFDSEVPTSMLYRLALDDSYVSDADIQVFLHDQFSRITKRNPSISSSWPTALTVDELVKRSCGQFVYASTVMKYISSSKNPVACLNTILEFRCSPAEQGMPFAELDALYTHILSSVKDPQITKLILGVVLFVNPDYDLFASLSCSQISAAQTLSGVESLLGLETYTVKACLTELYPMITYSQRGEISIPHATVAEFLNDPARSKSFHIEKSFVLTSLTRCCFDNIKNGSTDDDAVRFSYGRIPQLCGNIPITPDLQKDLKEFSLSQAFQWCQANADRIGGTLRRRSLFPWWYITKLLCVLRQLEITEVYLHQLSAFDKLVHANLGGYAFATDVHLLVALKCAPSMTFNPTQSRVINLLTRMHIGSSNFTLDAPAERLGVLSMYPEAISDSDCFRVGRYWDQDIVIDIYHQFLVDFFLDPTRSGHYCLSSEAHTSVTKRLLQFASRILSDYATATESDRDAIRTTMSFLPCLLRKSSNSITLLEGLPTRSNLVFTNSDDQDMMEDAYRAIKQYKKRIRWWIRIGLLKDKYLRRSKSEPKSPTTTTTN